MYDQLCTGIPSSPSALNSGAIVLLHGSIGLPQPSLLGACPCHWWESCPRCLCRLYSCCYHSFSCTIVHVAEHQCVVSSNHMGVLKYTSTPPLCWFPLGCHLPWTLVSGNLVSTVSRVPLHCSGCSPRPHHSHRNPLSVVWFHPGHGWCCHASFFYADLVISMPQSIPSCSMKFLTVVHLGNSGSPADLVA